MYKIKQKVIESQAGWEAKQVMNLIYEKTGVRYHEVHVYRLLHRWGVYHLVPQKRFVNTASKEEKEDFKKEYWIYSQIPQGLTVAVQDESIFVHDVLVKRKLWFPKGSRPAVTVTGSHQKTCVFGALTLDGISSSSANMICLTRTHFLTI